MNQSPIVALAVSYLFIATTIPFAVAAETTSEILDRFQMELKLSDITDHKNEDAIIYLYKQNIIGGYPDGTFRPDGTINRAELLKILVGDKVASLDVMDEGGKPHPEYQNCFPDVHEEWFAVFVCYAKKQGWISGYPDGTFRPSQPVTKAEAVKMLVSIEGFAPSTQASPFDDVKDGDWYTPYIQTAYAKNLLELPRKGFASNPYGVGDPMTRANVVESMYRVAVMKEKGADTYMANDDLPERAQLTTGNLFPINLVNNQKWHIRIEVLEDRFIDVERDEDSFEVKTSMIDPHTGKSGAGYFFDGQYSAEFDQWSDGAPLKVYRCDYRYEYIREGIVCDEYYIPTLIDKSTVHGITGITGLIDKDGKDWPVTIVSKATEEIPCNVKGQKRSGELIYYMPDSEAMRKDDWRGVFKCFETDQDAIKAGYKKSYK
ncbi:hypothetical protein COU78_01570 [Candidatus Peregrinibacteria bacterium CG10_big_fil_rev_8_21_14_0_10_49_24]|nr:MAG: hypothetical protein COU78_01570 [Candidatus Peregrinibacteria bacterium CG10_big_fil_rev_8_21_14_0_10_49_24]